MLNNQAFPASPLCSSAPSISFSRLRWHLLLFPCLQPHSWILSRSGPTSKHEIVRSVNTAARRGIAGKNAMQIREHGAGSLMMVETVIGSPAQTVINVKIYTRGIQAAPIQEGHTADVGARCWWQSTDLIWELCQTWGAALHLYISPRGVSRSCVLEESHRLSFRKLGMSMTWQQSRRASDRQPKVQSHKNRVQLLVLGYHKAVPNPSRPIHTTMIYAIFADHAPCKHLANPLQPSTPTFPCPFGIFFSRPSFSMSDCL